MITPVCVAWCTCALPGELSWSGLVAYASHYASLVQRRYRFRVPEAGQGRRLTKQPMFALLRAPRRKKVAASMDDTLQNYMKAGGNKVEVQKEQKELASLKQERSALIAKGGLMTKRQREKLEAEKVAKDGEAQDEDDADAEPVKQSSRRGISRMRVS